MMHHTNILIKGVWYGCRNDEGYPFGTDGVGRSPLDNFESWDDLYIGAAGFGRPKMGEGRSHGIFCNSGLYPNGDQGKEQA